ncbi:hypothetical protein DFH09DRAFT_1464476 [Mycena vulgaris]|nr:hypothetical protein DFH09DRAFT_1464476 [Mycena vulgaris]
MCVARVFACGHLECGVEIGVGGYLAVYEPRARALSSISCGHLDFYLLRLWVKALSLAGGGGRLERARLGGVVWDVVAMSTSGIWRGSLIIRGAPTRGYEPPPPPTAHATTRGSSRGSSTRAHGAPFGAQRMALAGEAAGKDIGMWFRQSAAASAIRCVSVLFSPCPSISFFFGDCTFTRDSPSTRPFLPTSLPLLALTLILLLPSSFVSIRPLHHSKYS